MSRHVIAINGALVGFIVGYLVVKQIIQIGFYGSGNMGVGCISVSKVMVLVGIQGNGTSFWLGGNRGREMGGKTDR